MATRTAAAVARGADALGAADGDGSQSVAAAAARAHGLPFVCVPAGTSDHVALDLGLDRRDPAGALDAFTDGMEGRIDVGEVNGRTLLNNVSLGINGDAIQEAAYRDAKGGRSSRRGGRGSARPPRRRVVDDLGYEHARPAVVLVSNNPYALERPQAPGARAAFDGGRLGIIVLDAPGDGPHPPGREWTATTLEVRHPGRWPPASTARPPSSPRRSDS